MEQLEIKELQGLIIEWAKEKNINNPNNQYLKILEEIGETARAILKNDIPEIKDGIGDIAVTVIIYYWQKNLTNVNDGFHKDYESNDFEEFIGMINEINSEDSYPLAYLFKIADIHNTTLKECLNLAWNEIKNRKGKTVDGTFIKD